jgi:hypothetical protein
VCMYKDMPCTRYSKECIICDLTLRDCVLRVMMEMRENGIRMKT